MLRHAPLLALLCVAATLAVTPSLAVRRSCSSKCLLPNGTCSPSCTLQESSYLRTAKTTGQSNTVLTEESKPDNNKKNDDSKATEDEGSSKTGDEENRKKTSKSGDENKEGGEGNKSGEGKKSDGDQNKSGEGKKKSGEGKKKSGKDSPPDSDARSGEESDNGSGDEKAKTDAKTATSEANNANSDANNNAKNANAELSEAADPELRPVPEHNLSSWKSTGAPYEKVTYHKFASGICALYGMATTEHNPIYRQRVITILPEHCRPANRETFTVLNASGPARVDVLEDGSVMWIFGGHHNGWLDLGTIRFSTKETGPTLVNAYGDGWQNWSSSYQRLAYTIEDGQFCLLSGWVGARKDIKELSGAPIATLPAACRPTESISFNAGNDRSICRIDIDKDGKIKWMGGGRDHRRISLSGITIPLAAGKAVTPEHPWVDYDGLVEEHTKRDLAGVEMDIDDIPGSNLKLQVNELHHKMCIISGTIMIKTCSMSKQPVIFKLPPTHPCVRPFTQVFTGNNHDMPTRLELNSDGEFSYVDGGCSHGFISVGGLLTAPEHDDHNTALPFIPPYLPDDNHEPMSYVVTNGVCIVEGYVRCNQVMYWNSYIGTLPEECRPERHLMFALMGEDGLSRVDLMPDGKLYFRSHAGRSSWLSFEGTSFTVKAANSDANMLKQVTTSHPDCEYAGSHTTCSGWYTSYHHWDGVRTTVMDDVCFLTGFLHTSAAMSTIPHIMVLPEACRPQKTVHAVVVVNRGFATIEIGADGSVVWVSGTGAGRWMSVGGVSFSVHAASADPLPLTGGNFRMPGSDFIQPTVVEANGLCVLSGRVERLVERMVTGAPSSVITTLPSKCRPKKNLVFKVAAENSYATISINPTGRVGWDNFEVNSDHFDLTGVQFFPHEMPQPQNDRAFNFLTISPTAISSILRSLRDPEGEDA